MRRALPPLVLALAAACGGGEPPDPCAESPTFTNAVGEISRGKCLSCHSKEVMGAARAGAPEGMDFDDYATLQPAVGPFADAITSGRMPPTGPSGLGATTPEERRLVDKWRSCGYPQ
jgi:uncharacterized membrane protein